MTPSRDSNAARAEFALVSAGLSWGLAVAASRIDAWQAPSARAHED